MWLYRLWKKCFISQFLTIQGCHSTVEIFFNCFWKVIDVGICIKDVSIFSSENIFKGHRLIFFTSFTLFIGELALSSGLASQSNVTQWLHQKDPSLMVEKTRDCVIAAKICQESEHCTLLYENFKKTCGRESEQCKTLDGSHLCAALSKSLKETTLGNCQCNDPSRVECMEIWRSLFEDSCIQAAQMNQVPAFSEDYEDGLNQGIVSGWYSKEFRNIKYNHKYELTKQYLISDSSFFTSACVSPRKLKS